MKKRILIVDDDTVSLSTMSMIINKLSDEEVSVEKYKSAAEALHGLKKEGGEVGLILSDFYMPNQSGLDLINRVKAEDGHENTPICIVTSEKDNALEMDCLQAGAEKVFDKPLKPEDIVPVLSKYFH